MLHLIEFQEMPLIHHAECNPYNDMITLVVFMYHHCMLFTHKTTVLMVVVIYSLYTIIIINTFMISTPIFSIPHNY